MWLLRATGKELNTELSTLNAVQTHDYGQAHCHHCLVVAAATNTSSEVTKRVQTVILCKPA